MSIKGHRRTPGISTMTWTGKISAAGQQHRPDILEMTGGGLKLKQATCWVLAVLLLSASAVAARGGCDEDCKNEYVSNLGDCRANYENGDRSLENLEDCLADTRGEYDDCIDDCTALGAGGVVACTSDPRWLRGVMLLNPPAIAARQSGTQR
jgi:hypothetical protein